MVVVHLRKIGVATFNCRGCPLKGPGMLASPFFPTCQHLGRQLPGARVPIEGRFNPLEHEGNPGLLVRTARAAQVRLPVQQRQQQLVNPLCPPRGHSHLLQVLVHRLPPEIDESRDASALLADLVQDVLFHRQSVRFKQRLERLELDAQLLFNRQ